MNEEVKERSKIDPEYTWKLTDIFSSDSEWEKALSDFKEEAPKILEFKGKLGESPGTLLKALDMYQKMSVELMELYAYAKMSKDLDNKDPGYQGMYDRIVSEYFKTATMTAFLDPELSCIDTGTIKEWLREEPGLDEYGHYLDNLVRNKDHILSETEEKLLSGIGPAIDGIGEAFSMMNDVELDFGEVIKADGTKVKLTHGSFGALREDQDRDVRRQAYEKIHSAYKDFGNTLAAIYSSSVKSDVFFSQARKFDSCMSRAMFADQLPENIYTNLISSIHENLPAYYKYLEVKKKSLGLDELHIYDTSVPLIGANQKMYDFEESKDILREGFKPLGEDYLKDIEKLFSGRAIDVYETKGKTSGAYAWGTYKTHPYMLLNWSGKLDDVFTFAHESGHCMHSYYSVKNQSYINSHYPIFLAEIASTVNENILLRYLLGKCDTSTKEGKREKAALLDHYLEGVKSTVIRQTMFAEFELKIHEMIESGQAVTATVLSSLYDDLLKLYFGKDMVIDDYITWEWARIPHFYNAFYVYKYATGFCAAALITEKIFTEPNAYLDYIKFLSSGGSDYPADILKIMGVDMTEPDAVNSTMELFKKRVDELEELLAELNSNE